MIRLIIAMLRPLFSAAVLLLVLVGCGDAESPAANGGTTGASISAVADTASLLVVLNTDDRFSTFVTALDSAGLAAELAQGGPFTVFAPTNAAFDALPPGTMTDLLAPERHDRLRVILEHHLLPRRLLSRGLVRAGSVQTRAGGRLRIQQTGGGVRVDSVAVLAADAEAANGVIHVLDAVLPPPG